MVLYVPMLSTKQLSPTSYLVLGLLAREGPSTPYDLKRHVAATLGHFWSFPHALLYAEPPRQHGTGDGGPGASRSTAPYLHHHTGGRQCRARVAWATLCRVDRAAGPG